jgi:Predicted Zn-dependent proteases and their inactivated homologs
VVENGVFKMFLHNIYTAKKSNQESTANSVRAGYRSVPQTGIHNFYLVPKNNSLETLLGAYEECVYITELMGLHMADPISGNFSLGASGIVYKNAKPMYAIRAVTVASNFLELLKKIKLIGNDFRFFGHVGSPSVLVENITIGGV